MSGRGLALLLDKVKVGNVQPAILIASEEDDHLVHALKIGARTYILQGGCSRCAKLDRGESKLPVP